MLASFVAAAAAAAVLASFSLGGAVVRCGAVVCHTSFSLPLFVLLSRRCGGVPLGVAVVVRAGCGLGASLFCSVVCSVVHALFLLPLYLVSFFVSPLSRLSYLLV